ncbi:hypothetical protein AcW1_003299 [Taiwanofungus camphoratus]|nr:hypothetical protein AcW1_003299 [Antrodia cinnamomea]
MYDQDTHTYTLTRSTLSSMTCDHRSQCRLGKMNNANLCVCGAGSPLSAHPPAYASANPRRCPASSARLTRPRFPDSDQCQQNVLAARGPPFYYQASLTASGLAAIA